MANNFLVHHLNSIEEDLKRYIEVFFYQITNIPINISRGEINELIQYIKNENNPHNDYLISTLQSNSKVDFNSLVDIMKNIYLSSQNSNIKGMNAHLLSTFNIKFVSLIAQELKIFRNLIHHEKNIEDELVQRFFENVYFFFKFLHLPTEYDIMSNYLKKDVTLALKCAMEVNLQNCYSFKLDYNFAEDVLISQGERKITEKKKEEDNLYDFNIEQLNYIYDHNVKTKLIDFSFKIQDISNFKNDISVKNNISYSSFREEENNNTNKCAGGVMQMSIPSNPIAHGNSITGLNNPNLSEQKFGEGNVSAALNENEEYGSKGKNEVSLPNNSSLFNI